LDLRTIYWKRAIGSKIGGPKGQLIYADALYFREPSQFQGLLNNLDPALGRSKLLRALSICQIYGYFDYALELIDLIGHTLFSREETKQLILHMQSQASIKTWIPNFPGRTKLYWKLMKIAKRIQPRSHKLKERYLGNR
jgi:hypothetical protein